LSGGDQVLAGATSKDANVAGVDRVTRGANAWLAMNVAAIHCAKQDSHTTRALALIAASIGAARAVCVYRPAAPMMPACATPTSTSLPVQCRMEAERT
jgi:hypothetical protein